MKVNREVYEELTYANREDELIEGFLVVKSGDWISEGKYETKEIVVKHQGTEKFYAIHEMRSGSYFSDYHYDEPEVDEDDMVELNEVRPYTRTIVEYY